MNWWPSSSSPSHQSEKWLPRSLEWLKLVCSSRALYFGQKFQLIVYITSIFKKFLTVGIKMNNSHPLVAETRSVLLSYGTTNRSTRTLTHEFKNAFSMPTDRTSHGLVSFMYNARPLVSFAELFSAITCTGPQKSCSNWVNVYSFLSDLPYYLICFLSHKHYLNIALLIQMFKNSSPISWTIALTFSQTDV